MIKKRRPEIKEIKKVVEENVGMPINEFLNPEKDYEIQDIDKARDIILDSVKMNKPITIVGDYDADGICASSILKLALESLDAKVKVRLPKRFSEGYGLSEKIIDEIAEGLLITVDNGIAAADAVKKAKDKGLTVIVTDHHLAPEDGILPEPDVLIDPNALEGSATFNGYCGAGIAYKLAQALIPTNVKLLPKLESFAAIATVTDVMKLVEENRIIVQQGLKNLVSYHGRTTGLGALLETCNMNEYITEKNIGFKIGPMINAPGRMADDGAMTAFNAVSYNSKLTTAKKMAEELFEINEERKRIKESTLDIVKNNIKKNCLFGDYPLVVFEPDLPEGLIGIFAGKIAEEQQTPCIMLTTCSEPGLLKGSARSYGGVNLKELLDKQSDFLYRYGGHAEAAGLSLYEKDLNSFIEGLQSSISRPDGLGEDITYYDIEINASEIADTYAELTKYAPYGEGNPEIAFYIKNFIVSPSYTGFYRTMGENKQHIKLLGCGNISAVGFDMTEKYIQMGEPKVLNIVGYISENYFMGKKSLQIEIVNMEDAAKAVELSPMAKKLANMAKKRYA